MLAVVHLLLLSVRLPRVSRGGPRLCAAGVLDVAVQRTASGGLGIEVDPSTNVVASNIGQPTLNVGDVIVAVDGEACGTRYIGALLKPGADAYTFSIERGTPVGRKALEGIAVRICKEAAGEAKSPSIPLAGEGLDAEVSAKMLALVGALEASGPPASVTAADLSGFWRLRFTDDPRLSAGASGFGLVPGCSPTAQFQLYGQPTPDAVQCVEVIANQMSRSHQVAALKGKAEIGAAGDAARGPSGPAVSDVYTRIELGGVPQSDSGTQRYDHVLTFLGDTIRICRSGAKAAAADGAAPQPGCVRVYEKQESDRAQSDLQALVSARVVVEAKEEPEDTRPRWEVADEQRRWSASGEGGPMPDSYGGIP